MACVVELLRGEHGVGWGHTWTPPLIPGRNGVWEAALALCTLGQELSFWDLIFPSVFQMKKLRHSQRINPASLGQSPGSANFGFPGRVQSRLGPADPRLWGPDRHHVPWRGLGVTGLGQGGMQ